MKYLIVGTGGVGGTLAGFLAQAGREVTCIARGPHKAAIEQEGLTLASDIKGSTVTSPVKAYTAEEYIEHCKAGEERPDVIFVAVKGYSLPSIVEVVRAAAHQGAVVVPILNVYGTGGRLKELLGETEATVLYGCIYVVAFRLEPGKIRQSGRVLKVVMGASDGVVDTERLSAIAKDIEEAGIRAVVSDNIKRETFMKWGFISAMSATGCYFDCSMGEIQVPGAPRELLTSLLQESESIGHALGIDLPEDYVAKNVDIIDHCTPDTTTSMQKDIAAQHQSEIDGQIFSMADLGHSLGLDIPNYDKVCQKFEAFRSTK